MGRLIDAEQIPFSSTTWGVITTPLMIDSIPTVDAIPRERINDMIAEIERKAHNNQFNEAVHFGMNSALRVIRKYTKEQNNEP